MKLQKCHATQITTDSKTTKWVVKDESNEVLYELPTHWTEKDVMEVIHFARKFEKITYEDCLNLSSKKMSENLNNLKITYENTINFLKDENLRLSNILEQLIEHEEI